MIGDRRQAAPSVDEDRHAPVRGQLEDRGEALVVQHEALRPSVELDPAGTAVEAARRLLDRLLRQVEADERDQPPVRPRGELERAVVRRPETWVAVGLVEAEHERPRDAEARLDPLEFVVVAAEAVDVVAEVDVGVEDLGAGGKVAGELGRPGLHQLFRALERFLHPGSLCSVRSAAHGPSGRFRRALDGSGSVIRLRFEDDHVAEWPPVDLVAVAARSPDARGRGKSRRRRDGR